MAEQANFSELRNKISNWDLEAEEMLINKMKIFTNSYKCDFANFTGNLQNFSNNLINTQVQSYKAISNLKELSMNRFIEEKLEENPESVSEGSDSGIESGDKKIINNNEKVKIALDMSMKTINEINAQKEKNKEKIEDDAVSIASKKLSFDNSKKYGNIPFIIGTENFMKDKNIGLTDLKEEEEEEEKIEIGKENEEEKEKENKNNGDWEILDDNKDDDFEEDMKDFEIDIPESEKDKKRWEKEKKKKKKEAKKKLQKSQINQNSNNLDINKNNSNDLNNEIKDQVKVPIESENDNKLENNQGNIVICEGKGASVPPPPPPPPAPVFNQVNIQKDIKKENKNESDKKQSDEINNQKENININININKKIPPNQLMNSLLLAGLKNIKDDDEDDDDGELFSKKNRKIPINNNLSQSQNPMIHMQNNLFNNINNTNNNNNLNINKKMTISKEKLNNIFGEENEEDLKIIKEEKEEDTKVKEEKSNNINNLEEPNKEKIENIFDEKNEKEENKENIEKTEVQKEENDSQQIIKDIPEQNGKNLNIKKNKLFSGLMEEEEKNNSEIIKPVESIKKQNKLNKYKTFFEDDDD